MEPGQETHAEPTGAATYSPEDNKLRLYVGRVPRDEFLKLRADGWVTLHKQRETGGGDFAAIWTPSRRDTALEYAAIIEDEDKGPAERAAERAERFTVYREKRTAEATGHADRYDAGPSAHGFQSQARAERSAARHDRIAGRACDAWSKAEYWQQRTAGVISHALYKALPGVRVGRIKTIEAEQRKQAAAIEEYRRRFETWKSIAAMDTAGTIQTERAKNYAGGNGSPGYHYTHPRTGKESSLWSHLTNEADPITGAEAAELWLAGMVDPTSPAWEETTSHAWTLHYRLRLAYETQMIAAEGGRAAFVEMVPGGWVGGHQIRKVNKSAATGRVVSVTLKVKGQRYGNGSHGYHFDVFNVERLSVDSYRPPTAEDLDALAAVKSEEKAAAPKVTPCPLVNPTDKDAERLQALWNEHTRERWATYAKERPHSYTPEFKAQTVLRITQETYSKFSVGTYAKAETKGICGNGEAEPRFSNLWRSTDQEEKRLRGPALCKVRTTSGENYMAERVIVLTDKPQKPLPAAVWRPHKPILAALVEASESLA